MDCHERAVKRKRASSSEKSESETSDSQKSDSQKSDSQKSDSDETESEERESGKSDFDDNYIGLTDLDDMDSLKLIIPHRKYQIREDKVLHLRKRVAWQMERHLSWYKKPMIRAKFDMRALVNYLTESQDLETSPYFQTAAVLTPSLNHRSSNGRTPNGDHLPRLSINTYGRK